MAKVCKKWSRHEELELARIFKEKTDEELGEIFGTSACAIGSKRSKLGLSRETWNDERDTRLTKIFHLYTDEELAEIFETTTVAVASRRWKLRLLRETDETEEIPEGHKRCSGCKVILPFELFSRNRTKKDGRDDYCKDCVSDKNSVKKNKLKKDIENIENRKQEALKEYAEKLQGVEICCKTCGTNQTINDYYLYANVSQKGTITVSRHCKICRSERVRKKKLNDIINKGY